MRSGRLKTEWEHLAYDNRYSLTMYNDCTGRKEEPLPTLELDTDEKNSILNFSVFILQIP